MHSLWIIYFTDFAAAPTPLEQEAQPLFIQSEDEMMTDWRLLTKTDVIQIKFHYTEW